MRASLLLGLAFRLILVKSSLGDPLTDGKYYVIKVRSMLYMPIYSIVGVLRRCRFTGDSFIIFVHVRDMFQSAPLLFSLKCATQDAAGIGSSNGETVEVSDLISS